MTTRVWSDLVLEDRIEYGAAAHNNRAQYTGQKIHQLSTSWIVGIVEGQTAQPGRLGYQFQKTGKPELFSARPTCGVTGGQHAGTPFANLTEEHVTCTKCLKAIERRKARI